MMKSQNDFLIGYYWSPAEFEHDIRTALSTQTATKIMSVQDNHHIMPPTYNKITDFTNIFQMIVDTYGVPTYKEANPVPVSIISFPFFFGMMFGDMGHGSILAFFGIFLVLMGHKLDRTALGGFVEARYFLMMMGLCSTYCGFLYNEFFAMPTQLFSSCYKLEAKTQWYDPTTLKPTGDFYYPRNGEEIPDLSCTYPMGMDPVWGLTKQKLNLANNVKMKLSVIYGVIHMSFGVVIKGTNLVMRNDIAGLLWEVIGGLIILLGLFGWMNLLIYGKWFFLDGLYTDRTQVTINGQQKFKGDVINQNAPSVVNILINTVFGGGSPPKPQVNYGYLFKNTHDPITWEPTPYQDKVNWTGENPGQAGMYSCATALLVIVIIFVPFMLCVKPVLFKIRHSDKH